MLARLLRSRQDCENHSKKLSETSLRQKIVHIKKVTKKLAKISSDHVYFVHPSTDISVVISTECQPICRSTYRSSVGRYVDRDMSVQISTDVSVDMSTDTRPICWSICRPRVVVQLSVDMSIDRLPTFRRYFKKGYCQLAKILPIRMPV